VEVILLDILIGYFRKKKVNNKKEMKIEKYSEIINIYPSDNKLSSNKNYQMKFFLMKK